MSAASAPEPPAKTRTSRAKELAAPGSPWRPVAAAAALAVGAIGAIAAPRLGLPVIVGVVGGALAAILAVIALPSLPTRQVTVILLGLAGLGALRHAALPATDSSLIVVWAAGMLVTLVLVDRAHAERLQPLEGGRPLPNRLPEAARVAALLTAIVVVVAVALVPPLTSRLGHHSWPGREPSFGDSHAAPESLHASPTLDMTTRPRLSDRVVFTVDSPRADFWRGEVYDQWDGHQWMRSTAEGRRRITRDGNTVEFGEVPYDPGAQHGKDMQQTFHIETGFSDVLFAAPTPVAIDTDRAVVGLDDGTIGLFEHGFSDGGFGVDGFGKGAVYTVTSRSALPTADDLRGADARAVPAPILDKYAQPPVATTRVRALAEQITAGAPTTYDKIVAIENWLGAHTRYSLNAPLSPKGADVVDYFLFDSRLGWCEQVSSSMVVLARSVGIPARLATGFVPGGRDGLTGRFVVRERDAHAWSEVYFPGVGWQGFDPTASVPLAGEVHDAGSWFDQARKHALELGLLLVLAVWLVFAAPNLIAKLRRSLARPTPWSRRALGKLERVGRKAGRARAPSETPREYARAVAEAVGDARVEFVGDAIDRDEFAAHGADARTRAVADEVLAEVGARKR